VIGVSETPVSEIPLNELLDEIQREEAILDELQIRLAEAYGELDALRNQLNWERVRTAEQRLYQRLQRIQVLEARILTRAATISRFDRQIRELQLFRPRSPSIRRMRRIIRAYEGWQTRDRRSLRTYRGWQTRELNFIARQNEIRSQIAYWENASGDLEMQIDHEDKRLQQKRDRVRVTQAQIVLVSITVSERAGIPYTKRFQGFYLIDCVRNPETGRFRLNLELTQIEIGVCIRDFYYRFNWIGDDGEPKLPHDTSEPRLTDVTSFELIPEPDGAYFLYCSVREEDKPETEHGIWDDDEDEWSRVKIYTPTPEEKEAFTRDALS
jgi:hypothetical protein